MAIKVLKPGFSTTVQDSGRPGYYNFGIPISGALDQYSYLAANLLVGNNENAAALECVFIGPTLEFIHDTVIAVTGAEITPILDGIPVPNNTAIAVKAGMVLSFDFMRNGARAYIAISGGIDVPFILGSRSTYELGEFGGFKGRKLQTGDILPIGSPINTTRIGKKIPKKLNNPYSNEFELHLVPGRNYHRHTEHSAKGFFDDIWSVAPEANRIGYRFRGGRTLKFRERQQPFGAGSDPSNIVDAAYPYGSIQVPGGLEPIILHRDAVSGGGYAMIGTVISADMDNIAQLRPNNKVKFISVDLNFALAAREDYKQRIECLHTALSYY